MIESICSLCEQAEINQHGIYHADCVGCAVREVKAARCGGKGHQEQVISRYVKYGKIGREDILNKLKGTV